MINEINYISIKEVMARVLTHPMLQDVTLEQVVRYTLDFMSKFGFNQLYEDKEEDIHIEDYRALLPCDLIRIIQLKDYKTHLCFRHMTDSYVPTDKEHDSELTYKTQGRILYTSIKCGDIRLSYKSIKTDEDGFPLLIDNPLYLKTLEDYIKCQAFTILFDMGKINQNVLIHAEQEYSWDAGQLQSEFTIPSVQEMESIKNMWTSLLQYNNHFVRDFKYGNQNHNKIV